MVTGSHRLPLGVKRRNMTDRTRLDIKKIISTKKDITQNSFCVTSTLNL